MNISETLISFETAVLAKEKGFNAEIKCYFDTKKFGQNPVEFFGKLNANILTIWNTDLKQNIHAGYISCPSQSLLQKWIREIHNFHISINVGLPHKSSIMYYSNVIKFGREHKSKYRSIFYKTYEEALEIGLQKALQLINK